MLDPTSYGPRRAFLYSGGVIRDLGTLGGQSSWAWGVNASGEVVGWSETSLSGSANAFLYSGGVMRDLGTLSGLQSDANAINDAGDVVGYLWFGPNQLHAFVYRNGAMHDLGTLQPGGSSRAYAINASGQITISDGPITGPYNAWNPRAYVYSNGTMTDLGAPSNTVSYPLSINASGQIVGSVAQSNGNNPRPFLYTPASGLFDPNSLVPPNLGWVLDAAVAINDAGQIIGYGTYLGQSASFLLTISGGSSPVTRPASHVAPLPPAAPGTNFAVQWSGSAPGVGVRDYAIYVSDNGGLFTPWLSATTGTQATYSGVCEHTYGFFSMATDNKGIQEIGKTTAEATTRVPFNPVSHVLALPTLELSPNFNVQWAGVNTCTPIATWDIYVSDNGGAFTIWKARTSGTQAYFSGMLGHTYRFYSIAFDNGGGAEAPKTSADAMTQTPAAMAADVNSDGRIDCTDVSMVKAAIGTRTGQGGFNAHADVNGDGLVDVRDLAIVTQKLAPGTTCP